MLLFDSKGKSKRSERQVRRNLRKLRCFLLVRDILITSRPIRSLSSDPDNYGSLKRLSSSGHRIRNAESDSTLLPVTAQHFKAPRSLIPGSDRRIIVNQKNEILFLGTPSSVWVKLLYVFFFLSRMYRSLSRRILWKTVGSILARLDRN